MKRRQGAQAVAAMVATAAMMHRLTKESLPLVCLRSASSAIGRRTFHPAGGGKFRGH